MLKIQSHITISRSSMKYRKIDSRYCINKKPNINIQIRGSFLTRPIYLLKFEIIDCVARMFVYSAKNKKSMN
jgi:hypothetical protein